jgi:D-3-phosphoglycerate dehydrogenase
MRLLAIADTYIPAEIMGAGLAPLADCGVEIVVRQWTHDSLIALQEANLAIEQGGPEAVPLPDELSADLESFDMLVVQFAPVPARWLHRAAALRVIGVLRGGTENVDVAEATARGICVLNTPGRNARAVAECTLGLILAEVRNIARAHAGLRQGRWEREFPNTQEIPELYGKTVGLIGYGAVARLVAHYLVAFGSRIIAYDPYCPGDAAPAELVSLDELLRTADVISLHARLTPDNQHLLGAAELAKMKPSAILVNTARSGLIDEAALVDALTAGRIQGAALDVFDCEPLPLDHPLLRLANVTVTPHLAGSTIDAFRNSPRLLAGHLARLLAGEEHVPIINHVRPAWRTPNC